MLLFNFFFNLFITIKKSKFEIINIRYILQGIFNLFSKTIYIKFNIYHLKF